MGIENAAHQLMTRTFSVLELQRAAFTHGWNGDEVLTRCSTEYQELVELWAVMVDRLKSK